MKKNRTSSFPADLSDKIVLGWCVVIVVQATAAHWVYTDKDAWIGIFLMSLVTAQCVCLALYRRFTKNKNNDSAGT